MKTTEHNCEKVHSIHTVIQIHDLNEIIEKILQLHWSMSRFPHFNQIYNRMLKQKSFNQRDIGFCAA